MKIMHNHTKRTLGFTLVEFMIGVAAIAALAAILIPGVAKARAHSQLTACKSNLRNIGAACEMYAVNNDGHYPSRLVLITAGHQSGYLKEIPSCPSCDVDTYSASYACATSPDAFTVRCGGENHLAANIPADFPLYSKALGLSCCGESGEHVAINNGGGYEGSKATSNANSGNEGPALAEAPSPSLGDMDSLITLD